MGAERITIPEAVMITGLCERTLQQLSQRGEIWGAAKLGRRWTYDRLRLRAWIAAKENAVTNRIGSTSATEFSTRVSPSRGESIDNPLRRAIEQKLRSVSKNG